MSLLCAYLISATPVNELDSYLDSDLGGNLEYKVDATVPAGYQDISSIENWDKYGQFAGKDYKYVRNEIIILAATITWSSLTTAEKTVAATYFAVGKTERDEIYTLDQQIQLGLLHHVKSVESRTQRLARVQMQLYNRLPKSDWEDVAIDATDLIGHYITEGREGTVEGDAEGLFDYIDGDSRTGTTWDTSGGFRNKSYTIEGYANCSLFADDLLDILKNGNY